MAKRITRGTPLLVSAASVGIVAGGFLVKWLYSTPTPKVYAPPSRLANDKDLPYPSSPPILPGCRDVDTPYGNLRVYEFGPFESTRRIVLLHGISTPSPAMAGLAIALSQRGARVLLLDLFGRGWSGGPGDIPYDNRLYTSMLLLAVASSSVSWTGSQAPGGPGFGLIGYSLGGGLAMDFASYFPDLIRGVALIAPGGVVRESDINLSSKIAYSGWLPQTIVSWWVRKRLGGPSNVNAAFRLPTQLLLKPINGRVGGDPSIQDDRQVDLTAAAMAELPSPNPNTSTSYDINVGATMQWQLASHPGFVTSFVSSLQSAPIHGQHNRWRLVAMELVRRRTESPFARKAASENPKSFKVLLFLGGSDPIVKPLEVVPDTHAILDTAEREGVWVRVFNGIGHEVAVVCGEEIAADVAHAWEVW